MKSAGLLISIIVPAYNEQDNIQGFHGRLMSALSAIPGLSYEVIYVDDGSKDATRDAVKRLSTQDSNVRLISFSRNFGKEVATSAGLHAARGAAAIMIDADGQHPPEKIVSFIEQWQTGHHVVIGVRTANEREGLIKRYGSLAFYRLFNSLTGAHLIPGSTDFRLIDRAVLNDFKDFTEHHRLTRGLIDWAGYQRGFIEFSAGARTAGKASYSIRQLFKLAINSFVSLSLAPLYISGWAGLIITPASTLLGIFIIIEQIILKDPLNLNFTGTAMLGVLILCLVGVLLMSQGLIALYISHIHTETQNRPLYIIDRQASIGL